MKNTINKTIPFKPKEYNETEKISKYGINDKSDSECKIIPYPKHKKNNKSKKNKEKISKKEKAIKKEKTVQFAKNNKSVILTFLSIIVFFAFIYFIDNTILKDRYGPNGRPIKSEVNVFNSDFVFHSETIDQPSSLFHG